MHCRSDYSLSYFYYLCIWPITNHGINIISKYLPSKTEYVLFCPMSAMQAYIFEHLVNDTFGHSTVGSSGPGQIDWDNISVIDSKCILATINQFRKICNHPSFIESESTSYSLKNLPPELSNLTYEEQGSKLAVVSCILHSLSIFPIHFPLPYSLCQEVVISRKSGLNVQMRLSSFMSWQ